jgi:hypothetical protein
MLQATMEISSAVVIETFYHDRRWSIACESKPQAFDG